MVGKSENYHESGLPSSAKTSNIMKQIPPDGNAPSPSVWKTDLLTCTTWGQIFCIRVHEVRLELTTPSSVAKCSIHWAIRAFVVVLPATTQVRKEVIAPTMTIEQHCVFTSAKTKYGEQDLNLHEVSLTTSLVLRVYHSTTSALRENFTPPFLSMMN